MQTITYLELASWRRKVAEAYARVRASSEPMGAWRNFRDERDALFRLHPQSPLLPAQTQLSQALSYFEYDSNWRINGDIKFLKAPISYELELTDDGLFRFDQIANVHFSYREQQAVLGLFWIKGYGGGLFLPFRDQTNGRTTYGGGRYLFDTIKGADLGTSQGRILLDFNFAYNPSCAYNDRWVCPLAPAQNHLQLTISAGERAFELK